MKKNLKRILSFAMALALVLSLVPAIQPHVHAATTKDFANSSVTDLGIRATNATGSGSPVCSWTASGTTVTGSLVGGKDDGGFLKYYYESTSTLTFTNNKTVEAELSFNYSVTSSGSRYGDITVNGTKYTSSASGKSVKATLAPGGTVTVVLHVPQRVQPMSMPAANGASVTITDLALVVDNSVSVNFGTAANGSYTVTKADGTAVDTSKTLSAQSTDRFTLTATPASGYAFSGWYFTPEGGTETFYAGLPTATDKMFTQNGTLVPKFIPASGGIWGVGDAAFDDYAKAISAASGADKTVVLLKNHTITGELTVPAGVTLLIPFDAAHTVGGADPEVLQSPDGNQTPQGAYRTLTMADGAKLTVLGNLEVGAKHHASHGGSVDGGTPYDYYGHIVMNGSSAIEIQDGGCLYAWGYITGSTNATVTAKSGAKVYEKMQVSDYRGGRITSTIVATYGIFPFNQYYIQNVEVKETLEYGSTLVCHAGIYGNGVEVSTVDFMGSESAMFTLSEGTEIVKYYDAATDRLIVEAYGDISMNAISIMDYDTSAFILPFNHNITVNVKSGTATINQDIMLLPGATINVDSGASLTLASGKKIHLMDANEWGNFCFGKKLQQISYVPSKGGAPNIRQDSLLGAAVNMGDATINVNGTFNVNGQVYATSSGAQIVSKDKTGVINFVVAAPTSSTTFRQSIAAQTSDMFKTETVTVYPAKLTNGDGSTIDTNGVTAGTTYNYCATCDCWYTGQHVYEIKWNVNGSISTSEVHAGKAVSYPGTTPTKAADADGHFIFAGWADTENGTVLTELPVAAANAAYYAVFTSEAHADTATKDHKCDTCGYATSTCPVDADKNHVCDICGHTTSHTDTNFDHICEYCKKTFSECKDDNSDCICDYEGCKKQLAHKPNADDGDCTTDITCSVCGTVTTEGKDAHSYTVEQSRTDATCMAQGSVTWKCANCNATTTETLKIDPANHTGVNHTENAKDATCTEAGYTGDTVCECGTTVDYGSTIPNTGHTNSEAVTENEVGATCTADGSYDTVVYCTVCGEELSRVTTTVPSTGHTAGTPVTENEVDATCTADGSYDTVVYCTVCGDEVSRETTTVSATGHTAGTAVTENEVDATCTADGSYDTVVYCTVCGEELSRVTTTVSATGHTAGTPVTENEVDATCTADGSYDTVIYCTVCGDEVSRETTTVSATGHTAGTPVTENEVDATCTADGSYDTVIYCTVCGAETSRETTTVSATGHDMQETTAAVAPGCETSGTTAIYTCANGCGKTEGGDEVSATGHTAGTPVTENEVGATCTADGSYDTVVYCTVCGEELSRETTTVSATGHDMQETTAAVAPGCETSGTTAIYTCANGCGKTEGGDEVPATGHTDGTPVTENEVDATCTADGSYDTVIYCTVCGAETSRETTTVSATGHDMQETTAAVAPGCETSGTTAIYTCANGCGKTEGGDEVSATGHTAGTPVTENKVDATCTADGSYDTVVYCTVCGEELSRVTTTVSATGHTAGTPVTENKVDATCTADGSYDTVVYCSVCGSEVSRETTTVPSAGHGEAVTYTNNGDTHSATYDCCGAVYVTDEGHTYVDGTCACGAEEPVATGLKGDVTLNGVVDMDDVVALMRHVLQAEIITDATALANGEVTNDTSLDMDDVVKLMQYVLKAIDSLD